MPSGDGLGLIDRGKGLGPMLGAVMVIGVVGAGASLGYLEAGGGTAGPHDSLNDGWNQPPSSPGQRELVDETVEDTWGKFHANREVNAEPPRAKSPDSSLTESAPTDWREFSASPSSAEPASNANASKTSPSDPSEPETAPPTRTPRPAASDPDDLDTPHHADQSDQSDQAQPNESDDDQPPTFFGVPIE